MTLAVYYRRSCLGPAYISLERIIVDVDWGQSEKARDITIDWLIMYYIDKDHGNITYLNF
jgi:hypothetical protein